MFLFFHELFHFAIGLAIGLYFFRKYKNIKLVLISLIASIFIDLDHLFDLWLYSTNFHQPFNPLAVISVDFFQLSGKIYILLHSYELIIILFALGYLYPKGKYYAWVIAVSFLFHIIIDQLTYQPNIFEYSFIYRLINNFSLNVFKVP